MRPGFKCGIGGGKCRRWPTDVLCGVVDRSGLECLLMSPDRRERKSSVVE